MKSDQAKKAEAKLLLKLQIDHGYMFADMARKSERTTMIFSRSRKTSETNARTSLTPARVVMCIAPNDSWLAMNNPISMQMPTKAAVKQPRGGAPKKG